MIAARVESLKQEVADEVGGDFVEILTRQ